MWHALTNAFFCIWYQNAVFKFAVMQKHLTIRVWQCFYNLSCNDFLVALLKFINIDLKFIIAMVEGLSQIILKVEFNIILKYNTNLSVIQIYSKIIATI